jgi:hypothetical protein
MDHSKMAQDCIDKAMDGGPGSGPREGGIGGSNNPKVIAFQNTRHQQELKRIENENEEDRLVTEEAAKYRQLNKWSKGK